MGQQRGFWNREDHYAKFSKTGDPLETLAAAVTFEPFRYRLEKALKRSDGAKGGRPAYYVVLMVKIMILQALYDLFDRRLREGGYLAKSWMPV